MNRNDKCMCGSGKKYKHCCIVHDSNIQNEIMKFNLKDLNINDKFDSYDDIPQAYINKMFYKIIVNDLTGINKTILNLLNVDEFTKSFLRIYTNNYAISNYKENNYLIKVIVKPFPLFLLEEIKNKYQYYNTEKHHNIYAIGEMDIRRCTILSSFNINEHNEIYDLF